MDLIAFEPRSGRTSSNQTEFDCTRLTLGDFMAGRTAAAWKAEGSNNKQSYAALNTSASAPALSAKRIFQPMVSIADTESDADSDDGTAKRDFAQTMSARKNSNPLHSPEVNADTEFVPERHNSRPVLHKSSSGRWSKVEINADTENTPKRHNSRPTLHKSSSGRWSEVDIDTAVHLKNPALQKKPATERWKEVEATSDDAKVPYKPTFSTESVSGWFSDSVESVGSKREKPQVVKRGAMVKSTERTTTSKNGKILHVKAQSRRSSAPNASAVKRGLSNLKEDMPKENTERAKFLETRISSYGGTNQDLSTSKSAASAGASANAIAIASAITSAKQLAPVSAIADDTAKTKSDNEGTVNEVEARACQGSATDNPTTMEQDQVKVAGDIAVTDFWSPALDVRMAIPRELDDGVKKQRSMEDLDLAADYFFEGEDIPMLSIVDLDSSKPDWRNLVPLVTLVATTGNGALDTDLAILNCSHNSTAALHFSSKIGDAISKVCEPEFRLGARGMYGL
jgi:hypothetical protein